jgi:DNA-binding MarR family transcriptional regulator
MIQASQLRFISPTKQSRLLSVLYSIYEKPEASQHKIAANTDLSSSMVNNYIKWLKREGFITVLGKTNRTQQYHLSETGRVMLRQSLLDYSAEIVRLYGTVKNEISNILKGFYNEGIRTIVLFGVAETAEIVYAAAKRTALVIIGVVDSDERNKGASLTAWKYDRRRISGKYDLTRWLSPRLAARRRFISR